MLYFAYGSNMSSARLSARVEGVRAVAVGLLHDFRLAFDKPGRDGTAKANVRRAVGARVHGVLFEIDAEGLAILDRFEPGYARHAFEVVSDGSALETAWTYAYFGDVSPALPSDEYLRHLIEGAREHALPADLIAWLEAQTGRG